MRSSVPSNGSINGPNEAFNFTEHVKRFLTCQFCKGVAQLAFQTQCCAALICCPCHDSRATKQLCPQCKQPCKYQQSKLGRKIIADLPIKCPLGCHQMLTFATLRGHKTSTCPLIKIPCVFCKELFSKAEIAGHTGRFHQQEARRALTKLHTKDQTSSTTPTTPLLISIFNSDQRKAHLGKLGKFYCSAPVQTRDIKFQCCPVANCNACMAIDIKRFRLPKGFLLNSQGRIAQYNTLKGNFSCNLLSETTLNKDTPFELKKTIRCNGTDICQNCASLTKAFKSGLYNDSV